MALAQAALEMVEEVVFVLPRALPHKTWVGASFEDRVELLVAALNAQGRFSIASTRRGLFVEIAAECREAYGQDTRLSFLCGADAAERIVTWDYGEPDVLNRMMEEFDLLVAERCNTFTAPRCRPLRLRGEFAQVSATEVRDRIVRGKPWRHLVPDAVQEQVARIYAACD
jgi:nicotinic acid mononucleotide adenylyltransferase